MLDTNYGIQAIYSPRQAGKTSKLVDFTNENIGKYSGVHYISGTYHDGHKFKNKVLSHHCCAHVSFPIFSYENCLIMFDDIDFNNNFLGDIVPYIDVLKNKNTIIITFSHLDTVLRKGCAPLIAEIIKNSPESFI